MLKIWLKYCSWIIRYGGKKNIPPEVIFDEIDKNMLELKDNMMQAIHISPPQMTGEETEEERQMFKDLMSKINELGLGLKEVKDKEGHNNYE